MEPTLVGVANWTLLAYLIGACRVGYWQTSTSEMDLDYCSMVRVVFVVCDGGRRDSIFFALATWSLEWGNVFSSSAHSVSY